jgi:glutamyl-tRNA synthetase
LIYQALGNKAPIFCHIPMIQDKEGKKLSKRKCAAAIEEYIDLGYLPTAIFNYLLHLGGGYAKDIILKEEAIDLFDINKLGKSPSRFDFEKLKNINLHYIKLLSSEELIKILSLSFKKKYNILLTDKNINSLKALVDELTKYPLINDMMENLFPIFDNNFLINELKEIPNSINVLEKFLTFYQDTYITKESLNSFLDLNEIKMKDFGKIIRICLVGRKDSFSIVNLINSLDKKEIIFRIEKAISFLNVS